MQSHAPAGGNQPDPTANPTSLPPVAPIEAVAPIAPIEIAPIGTDVTDEPKGATAAPTRAQRRKARKARKPRKRRSLWLYLRDFLIGVAVLAIFALAAGTYYLERFEIRSGSMEPTLPVGEIFWGARLLDPPERGELVAFRNPNGNQMVIKRVIALPGEMIEARDGIVWVNLSDLNEGVWVDDPERTADFALVTLGPDEYFMMGDNRDRSTDSRSFGPIALGDIEYRLLGVD